MNAKHAILEAIYGKDLVTIHSFPDRYPTLRIERNEETGEYSASLGEPPGNAYVPPANVCYIDVHLAADAIDWNSEYRSSGWIWENEEEWNPGPDASEKNLDELDKMICIGASERHIDENIERWTEEAQDALAGSPTFNTEGALI